jgi:hypothetical protein
VAFHYGTNVTWNVKPRAAGTRSPIPYTPAHKMKYKKKSLLHSPGKPAAAMKRVASTGGSVIPVTQWDLTLASQEVRSRRTKISIIKVIIT